MPGPSTNPFLSTLHLRLSRMFPSSSIPTLEGLLHRITDRIRRSIELPDILTSTATETQRFLATDRVKVYRFHDDDSGEVVAEAMSAHKLPSLLGHRFPAEDIPDRSREMFLAARQRTIVNVAKQEIGISHLVDYRTQRALDHNLWFRPVDPCHVEYLTAMGVQASLVVPLLHHNRLWGLLVAHHSTPRWFSPQELEMMQLIADQVTGAIAHATLLTQSRLKTHREATLNRVASQLQDFSKSSLQTALHQAVTALNSTGGRLYLAPQSARMAPQILLSGAQPSLNTEDGRAQLRTQPPVLEELPDWQTWLAHEMPTQPGSQIGAITDTHQAHLPPTLDAALRCRDMRGLLVMRLCHQNRQLGYLSVFRQAIAIENIWAGRLNTADPRQNRPRQSFETWRELKRDQVHPWTAQDLELAQALADQFASVIYQTQLYQEVQRLNADLEKRVFQRTAELECVNTDLRLEILERERTLAELQQAKDSLKQLSHQNDLILRSAGDGIYGLDAQGQVVFVNPAAAKMLEQPTQQLIGQFIHPLIAQARPDGTPYEWPDSPIYDTLHSGQTNYVSGDLFHRQDGTSFATEYVSTPLREADRILGVVVTFRDITERQMIERMKDEFISVVSHELRTPLTSIRAALGLLAATNLDIHSQKRQRMVEIAFSNTNRLVRLVNDILDVERIKLGKVTLSKQMCDLADILAQAADEMRAIAEKNRIHLAVKPLSVKLWADPDRLIQTFTNLLSNAIKFSPAGSTVTVIAETIHPGQLLLDPTHSLSQRLEALMERRDTAVPAVLLVQVKDQGQGIPENKLEVIFQQFEQLNVSNTGHQGGTGLGLAICRSIVQQHDGHIWAENNANGGSTFFVVLPLSAEPDRPAQP
ncbi:MAG: ATP-binding protein [Cyanobacteria bacterium P01_H01_bin.162]